MASSVYVTRDDTWKLAFHQHTPLQPDAETRTLNARAIAAWPPQLADAVEAVMDAGEFPVVLGGDCTIVLGSMLALRRRGLYGLFFIDGHADFFQPDAEPNGEGASMDLAFVTGYGPALLTNIEGRSPLVRPEDAAFAFRDHQDQAEYGSQPLPPADGGAGRGLTNVLAAALGTAAVAR